MKLEDNRKPTGPRVLDGVRVLDFTCVISGPYCTRMMADLGADVLKIEPPEGEIMRAVPPHRDGASTLFAHLNAGKRCITLDLKQAASVATVKRLAATVDVVVENFSPGAMQRLGLDYANLKACNEQLIMCSISGFGQTGPDAEKPAFAPIVHAWSGWDAATLRYQPGIDKPLNLGPPVADNVASLQAFGAITSALYYREKTGQGQYIDIAMFDALLGTMQKDFQVRLEPTTLDRLYGPLATADGYVMMMLISPRHFTSICTLIGRPELTSDPRFATTPERLNHYQNLLDIVAGWTRGHPTESVVAALTQHKIPVSPYRDIAATVDDPQLRHRNMFAEVSDAGGALTVPNTPFLYSATQAAVRPWVASIGEHNDAVFGEELGLDPMTLAHA
jgi:crotonobetainyl-CoA:carnitine CoA-transferase CaiB-like acyl-CoA transferase